MIRGVVRAQEARIKLKVRGQRGRGRTIDAVIDTGFTASLTLPRALIHALGLHWHSFERGTLADGSDCMFDLYVATVVWDGIARRILVAESEADPLVGMALLEGFELTVQVRDGGKVAISRMK
jgi:clan AA aspartic protease